MITQDNYFQKVKEIDYKKLPEELQKEYRFGQKITNDHTRWKYYHQDKDIKSFFTRYFKKLNDFLEDERRLLGFRAQVKELAREYAKKLIWNYVQRGADYEEIKKRALGAQVKEYAATIKGDTIHVSRIAKIEVDISFTLTEIYKAVLDEMQPTGKPGKQMYKKAAPIKSVSKSKAKEEPEEEEEGEEEIPERESRSIEQPEMLERITEEVKFIKRFVVMQGKQKTDVQLLSFINALQKAILERRIRKYSLYAQEIKYIQQALVNAFNKLIKVPPHRRILTIKINDHVFKLLTEIANSQKALLSVNYLKRYIGIQGKRLTRDKVERLLVLLDKAAESRKLLANDPYIERIKTVYNSLTQFLKVGKRTDTLEVHPGILNGINEALEGCDCCDEKKKSLS